MMDLDVVVFTAVLSYIKRVLTTDTIARTMIAWPANYYARPTKIVVVLTVMETRDVFGGELVFVVLENINQEMTRITELA